MMSGTQLISICLVIGGGLIWWLRSGLPSKERAALAARG